MRRNATQTWLTEYKTVSEPQNLPIDELYDFQKRRSKDFEAQLFHRIERRRGDHRTYVARVRFSLGWGKGIIRFIINTHRLEILDSMDVLLPSLT